MVQAILRAAEGIYTVSGLTQEIKGRIEETFPSVWVEGEVSNFRVPSSGHFYFTLKDDQAQIRVVMFRSRNQSLRFVPEDGLQVILRAGVTVYPARGEYQLVADWMEPKGRGALQLAFEALKRKLAAEGLFDAARKRRLPFFPRQIGLITSPTGAAIRDILQVLWRRCPGVTVRFCPVSVQGDQAKDEIVEAIRMLNEEGRAEVMIVGRGGGSLEDLWAFNEESVARAIAASLIPVISAVGHEIDYTIADFVADLRAPTPSAAAEIVIPERSLLIQQVRDLRERLSRCGLHDLARKRERVHYLSRRLLDPGRRVRETYVRLDELSERMNGSMARQLERCHGQLDRLDGLLWRASPRTTIRTFSGRIEVLEREIARCMRHGVSMRRQRWREVAGRLESLSPLGVLARGYSITRHLPSGRILRSAENVCPGERLAIVLAQGGLSCSVEAVHPAESQGEGR